MNPIERADPKNILGGGKEPSDDNASAIDSRQPYNLKFGGTGLGFDQETLAVQRVVLPSQAHPTMRERYEAKAVGPNRTRKIEG